MSGWDNAPYIGCDGCAGTTGRAGCAIHRGQSFSVVELTGDVVVRVGADPTAVEGVLDAIRREYMRAREKHAPLHSGHEAIGVIEEEWAEFRLAVFFGVDHRGERADPAHEAIQIAAMALAYVVEAYKTWEWHPSHAGGGDD